MAQHRNVGKVDHISWLLPPESFESCVTHFEAALGASFTRAERADLQLLIAMDWTAGLEIVAPTGPESPLWSLLRTDGSARVSMVFGVDDLDAAKDRVRSAGLRTGREITLDGTEPWYDRFEKLRQSPVLGIAGIDFSIGELVTRDPLGWD